MIAMPPGHDSGLVYELETTMTPAQRNATLQFGVMSLQWREGLDVAEWWDVGRENFSQLNQPVSSLQPLVATGHSGSVNYEPDDARPWAILFYARAEAATSFYVSVTRETDVDENDGVAQISKVASSHGWAYANWTGQGYGFSSNWLRVVLDGPILRCNPSPMGGSVAWFGDASFHLAPNQVNCGFTAEATLRGKADGWNLIYLSSEVMPASREVAVTAHGTTSQYSTTVTQAGRGTTDLGWITKDHLDRQDQPIYMSSEGTGDFVATMSHEVGPDWSAFDYRIKQFATENPIATWLGTTMHPCNIIGRSIQDGLDQNFRPDGFCTGLYNSRPT